MIFLSTCIILWSFLEASFWWVAPDISISIAYVHFPHYWKRFIMFALVGALLGSVVTYAWAEFAPNSWLNYVVNMPFHSQKNIQYVKANINEDTASIIKGAWGGIPYKLFFGVAPSQGITFFPLLCLGLLSRSIRFGFVLGVTYFIRFFSRPWSIKHPTQLSVVLLIIWGTSITLFDVVINKFFV